MIALIKVCFASVFLIILPAVALANVPLWTIVPSESSLRFTATQNGAPVTGVFKTFTGDINYDPNQLAASHVKIIVDIASISDAYNQMADTLKSTDWFNVKLFPKAIFESNNLTKINDKQYQAKGTLTIRDKSVPVTLMFSQEEYTPSKARVKGSVIIKRTDFGVGQGDWANTDTVKDDVKVEFMISAVKK